MLEICPGVPRGDCLQRYHCMVCRSSLSSSYASFPRKLIYSGEEKFSSQKQQIPQSFSQVSP